MFRNHTRSGTALTLALLLGLATACSEGSAEPEDGGSPSPTGTTSVAPTADPTGAVALELDVDDRRLDVAVDVPHEDSVYPNVGDPRTDALAYQVDLTWDPERREVEGTTSMVVRAASNGGFLRLDLGSSLDVERVTVDADEADVEHNGKDLLVHHRFRADQRYLVTVEYAGRPVRVPAPTSREDLTHTGWLSTGDGFVTTLQQPWGAFTWFPVNDQPGDRALYDITVHTPEALGAWAGGTLESAATDDDWTATRWRHTSPVAAHRVGLVLGDYETVTAKVAGTRITLLLPPEEEPEEGETEESEATPTVSGDDLTPLTPFPAEIRISLADQLEDQVVWLSRKLGRLPSGAVTVAFVDHAVTGSADGLVTIGVTDEAAATPDAVVRGLATQWLGGLMPADWRDAWLASGLPTYLSAVHTAETTGTPLARVLAGLAKRERAARAEGGPAGSYDPRTWAGDNLDLGGALAWHAIRVELGDATFWKLLKELPGEELTSTSGVVAWLGLRSGTSVGRVVDRWLTAAASPAVG